MDEISVKILLGFAGAHFVLLLTIITKIWGYIKEQSINEYQHQLMWDAFCEEHFKKEGSDK